MTRSFILALLLLPSIALPGAGCKRQPAHDPAPPAAPSDKAIGQCIQESEKELKGACPGELRPCADNQTQSAAHLTLISCYRRSDDRWEETTEKSVLRHKAMIMFIASRSKEGGVDCWFASKKEWEQMEAATADFVKKWADCTRIREDDWF